MSQKFRPFPKYDSVFALESECSSISKDPCALRQYGLSSFEGGIQNWKDFCLKAFVFKGSPLTAADLGSYLNFAGKNIDVFKSDRPLKFRYSEKALKI